jgi:hypothetical protein
MSSCFKYSQYRDFGNNNEGQFNLLEDRVYLVRRDLIQTGVALIDRKTPLIFYAVFYVGTYASYSYAGMAT